MPDDPIAGCCCVGFACLTTRRTVLLCRTLLVVVFVPGAVGSSCPLFVRHSCCSHCVSVVAVPARRCVRCCSLPARRWVLLSVSVLSLWCARVGVASCRCAVRLYAVSGTGWAVALPAVRCRWVVAPVASSWCCPTDVSGGGVAQIAGAPRVDGRSACVPLGFRPVGLSCRPQWVCSGAGWVGSCFRLARPVAGIVSVDVGRRVPPVSLGAVAGLSRRPGRCDAAGGCRAESPVWSGWVRSLLRRRWLPCAVARICRVGRVAVTPPVAADAESPGFGRGGSVAVTPPVAAVCSRQDLSMLSRVAVRRRWLPMPRSRRSARGEPISITL